MATSKLLLLQVACCGILLSAAPVAVSQVEGQQTAASEKSPSATGNVSPRTSDEQPSLAVAELPDSPGATFSTGQHAISPPSVRSQQGDSAERPATPTPSIQLSARQTGAAMPADGQPSQSSQSQSSSVQQPVGTAAAGAIPTTGVAASQPAGVAIAPAKQRRVRSIVLRTGAIIAAGVAVGSVVALTEGTSSRPPGAH
jgi:hypothetical protein